MVSGARVCKRTDAMGRGLYRHSLPVADRNNLSTEDVGRIYCVSRA